MDRTAVLGASGSGVCGRPGRASRTVRSCSFEVTKDSPSCLRVPEARLRGALSFAARHRGGPMSCVGDDLAGPFVRLDMPSHPSAVDLFCGAGGLSFGLQRAGIEVRAGIDLDPACRHPFVTNVGTEFLERDLFGLSSGFVDSLFAPQRPLVLSGCGPCQPFSTYTNGRSNPNSQCSRHTHLGRHMSLRHTRLDPLDHQQPPHRGKTCISVRHRASCVRRCCRTTTTLTQEAHPTVLPTSMSTTASQRPDRER